MKDPRYEHTASLLADGKVLITGGCFQNSGQSLGGYCTAPSVFAEIYDPASGRWARTATMAYPRTGHTATLVPSTPKEGCKTNCGNVLVVGASPFGEAAPSTAATPAEIYDPRSGKWRLTKPTLASGRSFHNANVLADGRIMILGGIGYVLGGEFGQNPPEVFNPTDETWHPISPQPVPRVAGATSTMLTDGSILVAGGLTVANPKTGTESVERYSAAETGGGGPKRGQEGDAWRPLRPMATPRYAHTATPLKDGNVLVTGGSQDIGGTTAKIGSGLTSSEIYDVKRNTWIGAGSMGTGRGSFRFDFFAGAAFTSTLLNDGRVIVVGLSESADIYTPRGAAADHSAGKSATRGELPGIVIIGGVAALLGVASFGLVFFRRRTQSA